MKIRVQCILALTLLASNAFAQPYPPDIGYINVRSCAAGEPARTLAVGDGITDDTAAFEQAISACVQSGKQTVYVPAGTYRITRPLPWRRLIDGKWAGQCSIEGESRAATVIFLGPEATGFGDAASPNAVFITSSFLAGKPQLPASPTAKPGGNEGPLNSFRDLTIDTRSFPGAQGIDWVCSNRGAIERVKIKGAGDAGIDASREYPGPCLIQDVEVEGFNHGIRNGNTQFSLTLRRITVSAQRVSGIEAGGGAGMHIETLVSNNAVPAVRQRSASGALALIGATLMGGDPAKAAIEVPVDGRFFLRDIHSMGYRSALRRGYPFGTETSIGELASHPVLMAFPGTPTSIRIPAESEPEAYRPTDFARDCARPNSSPGDLYDDGAAIQAALDSGKPCVYLPHSVAGAISSDWYISAPLRVPATVQLIDGGDSFFRPTLTYPQGQPAIVIDEPSCTPLTIRRIWATGGLIGPMATTPWVDHRSPRVLVIRSTQLAGGNRGIVVRSGAGDVFLLDVFGSFDITDGRLYAWQLNTELRPATPVPNFTGNIARNSIVRVVGYKIEQDFRNLDQTGGMAEFLGCHLMPGVGTGTAHPVQPLWVVRDGLFAASYKVFSDGIDESPPVHLLHTKAGETRTITRDQLSRITVDMKTHDFAPLMVAR